MEDFNIYGWSALHEACYKGYSNAVIRFLDYARETEKNLIELRTIDDFKTTPIIIAALGGHMDVIELLVNNGADVNAELDSQNTKHGIIEVAAIRQHIELLVFMDDKIPDIPERLRKLMIADNLDKQSRASIGRTIETLSHEYMNIMNKLSKFKKDSHESRLTTLFTTQQIITYRTIIHEDFGYCLATFIKLNENNEDAIASAVMILLNVIEDEKIRKNFTKHKGIFYLVYYMENHKRKLNQMIDMYRTILQNKNKNKKKISWEEDFDDNESFKTLKESLDEGNNDLDLTDESDNNESNWIECASIGQALSALSKYDDCISLINKDGSNEKIINYVKCLFDFTNMSRLFEMSSLSNNNNYKDFLTDILNYDQNDSVIFEQYIGPFLHCLSNLTYTNQTNKSIFLNSNLFELILNFWKQIQQLNQNNTYQSTNDQSKRLQYFAPSSIYHPSSDFVFFHFEQSYLFKQQKKRSRADVANLSNENPFKNDELKQNSFSKILESLSPSLVKNLKLGIIECLETNPENNSSDIDWVLATNKFIKSLISYLDSINYNEREIQLEVLKFIRFITDNDREIQSRLVNTKNAFNSTLINNFRNLLRKSSPFNLRSSALFSLWALTGDKDYQNSHDRKCLLYRSIGVQKFVDVLFDSDDELTLISLEAITYISNAPPYRENEANKLIHVQEDVAKVHSVPAVLRILKTNNEKILFSTLKTLCAMCVTGGYYNCVKIQTEIKKLGGIPLILSISSKKDYNNRLRCEGYKCLSMICLNNSYTRKSFYKEAGLRLTDVVNDLMNFLTISNYKIEKNTEDHEILSEDELEELVTQINAGLALCAFCYKNDDFKRRIVLTTGRIEWQVYKNILVKLTNKLLKAELMSQNEICFEIEKLRCQLGFQIAVLQNLINDADEDPRAIGMKIMVELIVSNNNSLIRSLACDYIGRVICTNDCLIESFMSIGTIEALASSAIDSDSINVTKNGRQEIGESEKGNASITLGFFTTLNPEARRNLLKLARKNPTIMDSMKYYNEVIHIDLITQWNHYNELYQTVNKENKLFKPIRARNISSV